MEYEVVIGLEIHAELSTNTKIFCSCPNEFGGEPNTHCCPICTGMPGVLPVLNRKVVEYGIKAGLALNCEISNYSKMDRKNYYYPDLPKAYQISQYDFPLCKKGYIEIDINDTVKRIGITKIHIEEDAGKLLHDDETHSLVDYNRCGVPLIEIVTEPDMRSPEEAQIFLDTLKSILEYINVSDCKMEEGSLRCDVNLSMRPIGQKELGTRAEMKNVNSFKAAVHAMEYEIKRQTHILESGGQVTQETRRWDDTKGLSFPMRSKEEAHDYRYFPEPDLVAIVVDDDEINHIQKQLPELPDVKKKRFIKEFSLPSYDAEVLTSSAPLSLFFEQVTHYYPHAKTISNWVMGDMLRIINEKNLSMDQIAFPPQYMANLLSLIDKGTITGTIAKQVFEEMFETGEEPNSIVTRKGLKQINDEDQLKEIITKILLENRQSVIDYQNGKEKAIGFLVGQTMKATKGKANPQTVNTLIKAMID